MDRPRSSHRHGTGITRRELLQVGYSALLGIGVPSIWARRASTSSSTAPRPKANSVALIFLTGAPSHLDTFDLKPEAPLEIRGDFKTIATSAPGVNYCEHLPQLAARAHKLAVIRSMTHGIPSHELGTHMMLTGINELPPGSTHMASRADWPCYASGLDFVHPRSDGVPTGVHLPTYLNNGYGFSGQSAGVLGAKFDPWQIKADPNDPGFRIDEMTLPVGLTAEKVGHRRELLAEFDRQAARVDDLGIGRAFTGIQDKAFTMLTSRGVKTAFELDREDPRLRDRYGRHMFGQSLLLARRLIQAGVPIVQANMGHMNNWDTHVDNCGQLRTRLLPPLDQGVSAFLDDLEVHGLLDETLIVMVGEFGRTPKIGQSSTNDASQSTGRDHWAGVFSAVFAGAGVRGGRVIGKSDKIAAYPATRGFFPADLGATIYHALGADPASQVRDQLGRPLQLNRGELIAPLFDSSLS
jgi:hypothetical protein